MYMYMLYTLYMHTVYSTCTCTLHRGLKEGKNGDEFIVLHLPFPSLPHSPAFFVPALPVLSSAPLLPPPHLVRDGQIHCSRSAPPSHHFCSQPCEGGREGRKEGAKVRERGGGWQAAAILQDVAYYEHTVRYSCSLHTTEECTGGNVQAHVQSHCVAHYTR